MVMRDSEIRTLFREAKDPSEMVYILADLNAVPCQTMRGYLCKIGAIKDDKVLTMTKDEITTNVSANVRRCMDKRNIMPTELSKRLGISVKMVFNIVNGISLPTLETLVNMSLVFGVTTDELLKGVC